MGRRCEDARIEDRVDPLPAQVVVTTARRFEWLEKQTDMKVVAGGRFELYSIHPIRVPVVLASTGAPE
jgi:hypothetical protein